MLEDELQRTEQLTNETT